MLQNRQGKTRLSRWYVPYQEQERKKIEIEVHRHIVQRESKHTNFLEVCFYALTEYAVVQES